MPDDTDWHLREVIHEMAAALAETDNALANFTCSEVDTIVRVVALADLVDAAAELVVCHARGETSDGGDQDGDSHEHITVAYWDYPWREVPSQGELTTEGAEQYVYAVFVQQELQVRAERAALELARQYVRGLLG